MPKKPTKNGKRSRNQTSPNSEVPIDSIRPSPENNTIYNRVDPDDPEIHELAKSICQYGIKEALVVTKDHWILSGHRRYAAAKLAGLVNVPVRIEPICRKNDKNAFLMLLREYNRQRDKTSDEKLREELVSIDPDEAYQSLIDHREQESKISGTCLKIRGKKRRAKISKAKYPMLEVIKKVIEDRKKFWPLAVRTVHYRLLNDPPLRHASKLRSTYRNDRKSYVDLDDLLVRARFEGRIPFEVIGDDTRPVTVWTVHDNPRSFIRQEIDGLLKGYWRNLLQSQPNHIEIMCEKNTVEPILKPVAMKYCITLTSGHGFCSIPPRYDMARRYWNSGEKKLVILMLSDFDPDGEEIAHSYARSMRDDFGIEDIHPVKVALTLKQIKEFKLPIKFEKANKKSPNYKRFFKKYGDDVWELEAVTPETLQDLLTDAIDSVLGVDRFNDELDAERENAAFIEGVRQTVQKELLSKLGDFI